MQSSSHNNHQPDISTSEINQLENRLNSLSRELKRQKLMTLALFMGAILAVSATKVISQNQTKELTISTLKIVDNQGRVKAFLSADPQVNKSGATLAFLDEKNLTRAILSTDAKNSTISFSGAGKNSSPMAVLGYCDNAGVLTLSNQNSKNGATIVTGKDVAGVVVTGPEGKEAFSLEVDKNGGEMKVLDANGKLKRPIN
jgi:uncharacterized protein (DUF2141 family)